MISFKTFLAEGVRVDLNKKRMAAALKLQKDRESVLGQMLSLKPKKRIKKDDIGSENVKVIVDYTRDLDKIWRKFLKTFKTTNGHTIAQDAAFNNAQKAAEKVNAHVTKVIGFGSFNQSLSGGTFMLGPDTVESQIASKNLSKSMNTRSALNTGSINAYVRELKTAVFHNWGFDKTRPLLDKLQKDKSIKLKDMQAIAKEFTGSQRTTKKASFAAIEQSIRSHILKGGRDATQPTPSTPKNTTQSYVEKLNKILNGPNPSYEQVRRVLRELENDKAISKEDAIAIAGGVMGSAVGLKTKKAALGRIDKSARSRIFNR